MLRGATGPIGILFNDSALSGRPIDEVQQEALAIYCSIIGSIIERKRAEEERRAALEAERITSERLRAIVAAADELIRTNDLETLYRRAVELAREKIGVERCALYILDESREWVLGTYGTDAQGRTTDEHSNKEPSSNHAIITTPREQQWVVFQNELKYWEDNQDRVMDAGWNVATAIRSAIGPIGIMFNDAALSRKPYDESLQQALALYCTMLANIIENKRLELQNSPVAAAARCSSADLDRSGAGDRFSHRSERTVQARGDADQRAFQLLSCAALPLRAGPGCGGAASRATAKPARRCWRSATNCRWDAASWERPPPPVNRFWRRDVRQDDDWRPNPHLPDTRGELAVPIKWRDQVLGILDVQSDRAERADATMIACCWKACAARSPAPWKAHACSNNCAATKRSCRKR